MNVSAALGVVNNLLPSLDYLVGHLKIKEEKYWKLVKIGRTHMQVVNANSFPNKLI